MHYQSSIITKFHGPTNTRGSRVSARLSDKSARRHNKALDKTWYVSWDDRLRCEENHAAAAQKCLDAWNAYYREEYGLPEECLTGTYTCSADGGGYVFLFASK